MLLTETVLNKFKQKLNNNRIIITEDMLNEAIKINSNVEKTLKDGLDRVIAGKKHIQILSHIDLDGITSAIAIVQYLKKKGFNNDNITITFGQYGDKKLKIKETPTKNKAVVISDFGKLSTLKIWDEFQFLTGFGFGRQNKASLVTYINNTDFSKLSPKEFGRELEEKFKCKISSSKEEQLKNLLDSLKIYTKIKNRKENPIEKITNYNIESYRLQDADPDFVVDHHNNDDNNLRGAKEGLLDIETPSNAAALGKILGVFTPAELDAINMIDGAMYDKNELKRATFLDDKYPAQSKERALAIRITAYIEQATKKDNRTAEAIVKNSGGSLESLASTLEKSLKLNAAKVKMLNALTKGVTIEDENGKKKKLTSSKEIYQYVKNIIKNEIPKEFINDFDGHKSKKKTIDGIDKKVFNPESSFYKNREGKKLGEMANFDQVKEKAQKTASETKTGMATLKDKNDFKELIVKNRGDLTDEEVNEIVKNIKSDDKKAKEKANKLFITVREKMSDDDKKKADKFISKLGRITNMHGFAMQKSDEFTDVSKHYPSRYAAALYSKNGWRLPFTIKKFSDFIQASKNPLYKGEVDFGKVIPKVKEVVKNYLYELKKNDKDVKQWMIDHVIDSMNYDSGGHKAILNFQGFNEFKAPSGARNDKFNSEKMLDRIKKANKLKNNRLGTKGDNFKNLTSKNYAILNKSEKTIEKFDKYKKELMDLVMKTIITETNRLYNPRNYDFQSLRVDKNDDELEVKD